MKIFQNCVIGTNEIKNSQVKMEAAISQLAIMMKFLIVEIGSMDTYIAFGTVMLLESLYSRSTFQYNGCHMICLHLYIQRISH